MAKRNSNTDPNQNRKYIEMLRDIQKEMEKDQKEMLTSNDNPVGIADRIQRVESFRNQIEILIEDKTDD